MEGALPGRAPLSKERILRAAVELADEDGLESLSLRKLAQSLGVVPMALYRHVAGKDELIDGMIDLVLGEIEAPKEAPDWKQALRAQVLAARHVLRRHGWLPQAIESRKVPSLSLLVYLDSVMGRLRAEGFSVELTHRAMHALGGRVLGFTEQLFDEIAEVSQQIEGLIGSESGVALPHLAELGRALSHMPDAEGAPVCDEELEFELALDLLLDGIEGLRERERDGEPEALEP